MSRFGDNLMSSRMTPSPRKQGNDPSIKTLCSKFISACHRSDRTPENKENINPMASPFVKRKPAFNPFYQTWRERLEHPTLSPNVFSNVMSPSQESGEFKWTIDDLSKIKPAEIEEEFHYEEHVDEQTETEMQKTIEKYFTKNHMVPSPWDCKLPKSWDSFTEVFNMEKQKLLFNDHGNQASGSCSPHSLLGQNASTQTTLSLPPELPENVSSFLKPYFNESGVDDMNTSMNGSLRRKLFFQNDEEYLSPVRLLNAEEMSPVMDNKCCPSTPAIEVRSDYTPLKNLSPVDISPVIRTDMNPPMCNDSCSAMQIDSAFDVTKEAACNTNSNQVFMEECFKVVESPKLTRGIRRIRKRRRFSQDFNMSISYSTFAAKYNSTKQISQKICTCDDLTMSVDIDTNDFLTESQDTGYGTACISHTLDKFSKTDTNFRPLTFNSWKNETKENLIIASTPTKSDNL